MKNQKKALTTGRVYCILVWRSEDSRWLLAVNPAEDINKILIVFVSLRLLDARAFFMSV